ncbi:hypothetical protein [Actinomadura oligospora]|uniref:hypothetical protein n=1 Tax=Actinomadura oligospora TaxID=111804 RepID=UPI0004B191F0|nr:hypothetical protein [Actinomadura oligospora]
MSRNSLSTSSKSTTSDNPPRPAGRLGRAMGHLGLPDALMLAGAAGGGLWLAASNLLKMSAGPAIVLSLAVGVGVFSWALAQIDRHRSRPHAAPPQQNGSEDSAPQAPGGPVQQAGDA